MHCQTLDLDVRPEIRVRLRYGGSKSCDDHVINFFCPRGEKIKELVASKSAVATMSDSDDYTGSEGDSEASALKTLIQSSETSVC